MPESEPKPKLIELVAPGAGQGWKAVLKNGKAVVVHEIPVPAAEAAAAVPRLQRLAEHRHPALSPVLAWGTDPNGVWVAVEPNEGTPLGSILTRGPFTPPAAAALGAAVLSGVAALHEAGIAMGGFSASAVRVTSNGDVRLAGHPAAAVRGAPSQSDLRADVRSCGMAVCAAFGVDPAGAPAPPNIPPGLVVTMRSMASGAMGPAADRAQGALREMASALLAPDRMVAAQSELALRAGGREMPSITPFLPKTEEPAPAPAYPQPPAAAPWGPTTTPASPPAPASAPAPAPASYVPPPPQDTPIRAPASYDAPERSVQTYPSLPAIPVPAPAPPPPAPQWEPAPSPPAVVPTWSEAPPRTPLTHPAAPADMDTNPPPPIPPAIIPLAGPPAQPAPPASAPYQPPAPASWEPAAPPSAPSPSSPSSPRSPFDTNPPPFTRATNPPAAAAATNPPVSATPAPSPPAPPISPVVPAEETKAPEQSWSPVAPPVWTPAGTGAAASTPAPPSAEPEPVIAPPPPTPVYAPARKPTVARQPAYREASDRPSWLIPAVIAIILILLLGTFGVIKLIGGRGSGGTAAASPSVKPSSKPTPVASPTPASQVPLTAQQVNALVNLPTSAAPIANVQFCSPTTPCTKFLNPPENSTACDLNSCRVEVAIYFSSQQKSGSSTYKVAFIDRCTSQRTDLTGPAPDSLKGRAVVIPGNSAGLWTLSLPGGAKSAAIVAITTGPSTVASAPLLLGADTCA